MKNNCIEFKVKQNESAHYNVQNYNFQDNVKYSIDIFETIKPANFICAFYSFTKIPKKYFGNADTEPKRYIDKREPARWKVIQKVMIDNDIKEVTVRLCPLENNVNLKTSYISKVNPIPQKSSTKTTIQKPIDKQIDELLEKLDWKKLKDKKAPKLLIIGCCDAKFYQPINLPNGEYVNYNFGESIIRLRKSRLEFYKELPDSYFSRKKRNRELTNKAYFMESLNENNRRKALDVYGSNRSPFYNSEMKKLYRDKIRNSNLHLLIISGLYGIIKHDDYINDYHLEIGKGGKKWAGNKIQEVVKNYISDYKIPNTNVFYSLSDNYLPFLNPIPHWGNLWLNHDGHGDNQANDLKMFLDLL
jgi:hypothetical protein